MWRPCQYEPVLILILILKTVENICNFSGEIQSVGQCCCNSYILTQRGSHNRSPTAYWLTDCHSHYSHHFPPPLQLSCWVFIKYFHQIFPILHRLGYFLSNILTWAHCVVRQLRVWWHLWHSATLVVSLSSQIGGCWPADWAAPVESRTPGRYDVILALLQHWDLRPWPGSPR